MISNLINRSIARISNPERSVPGSIPAACRIAKNDGRSRYTAPPAIFAGLARTPFSDRSRTRTKSGNEDERKGCRGSGDPGLRCA